MKQKSPELEIPEEVFYGGIPNCNLYVQRKDMDKGMLYGVMIYRMTQSFEDAAIILADSGRLQATAEKKHLLLTLYNGEWFENMRSQELTSTAAVPYRRESFSKKVIVLDFDSGFNMTEASGIAQQATAQSIPQLVVRIDSMKERIDSTGIEVRHVLKMGVFNNRPIDKRDSLKALVRAEKGAVNIDSIFLHKTPAQQRDILSDVNGKVRMAEMDLQFRGYVADEQQEGLREYWIEMANKFTLSLTCIIFFFIGASLGAIIRKGGLGVPVIISVLVFIVFYILDNTGFRMARQGSWTITFGKGLAPGVLIPLAAFVTYKANKDSVVFNMDAYRNFFIRLLGLREKRYIMSKEVIINDPHYGEDAERLAALNESLARYSEEHHLVSLPNPITVFFKYKPDNEVEKMAEEMESIIEDLSNTRDRYILSYINAYPIVSEKAHTRPFERKWLNIMAAVIFPLGVILYIRMCRFRLRLYRDMRQIAKTNDKIIERIANIL
jgi:lipopolysaccharide export system permease protein